MKDNGRGHISLSAAGTPPRSVESEGCEEKVPVEGQPDQLVRRRPASGAMNRADSAERGRESEGREAEYRGEEL